MEKPNEEKHDELIARGKKEDGTDIEIRQGSTGEAYLVQKDLEGKIIALSSLVPQTAEGEIKEHFAVRGIALTDEDIEHIKEKFSAMQEEKEIKKLDTMLNSINKDTSTEQ